MNLHIIFGKSGFGKTTKAREIISKSNFLIKEFGIADYLNVNLLKKTLKALAMKQKGGILVQMGQIKGMGIIFDDIDTIKQKNTLKTILSFHENHNKNLIIIYVTSNLKLVGLSKIIKKINLIRLNKPSYDEIIKIISKYSNTPDIIYSKLTTNDKCDFRSINSAINRIVNNKLNVGSGIRDKRFNNVENLETLIFSQNKKDQELMVSCAPLKISTTHAFNIQQLLDKPEDKIKFAQFLTFSANCWSNHLELYNYTYYSGLYAPFLKKKKPKKKLIKSSILSNQKKYNLIKK